MSDFPAVQDILRTVTLYRRKGDAVAERGDHDKAMAAWQAGLTASDDCFAALGVPVTVTSAQAQTYDASVAADAAELLGVRGGLLRRLGRLRDALASYRDGAVWESSHNLPQTYNRANSFKLALIVGDRQLAQVRPELSGFRDALEQRLSTDERAADDAWLWADLGDARLLLGDDTGAVSAYKNFVTRARTGSSVPTLIVLKEITEALTAHRDADAPQIAAALRKVETTLEAR